MARPSKLPVHPRELVLSLLTHSATPMTAYQLLERLAPHGVKGAPVVYRALESLMKGGAVHKIQAINAFVACNCDADHAHALSVLTVCRDCRKVRELHDHGVIHHLEKLRKLHVPLVDNAVIELPVTCKECTG